MVICHPNGLSQNTKAELISSLTRGRFKEKLLQQMDRGRNHHARVETGSAVRSEASFSFIFFIFILADVEDRPSHHYETFLCGMKSLNIMSKIGHKKYNRHRPWNIIKLPGSQTKLYLILVFSPCCWNIKHNTLTIGWLTLLKWCYRELLPPSLRPPSSPLHYLSSPPQMCIHMQSRGSWSGARERPYSLSAETALSNSVSRLRGGNTSFHSNTPTIHIMPLPPPQPPHQSTQQQR